MKQLRYLLPVRDTIIMWIEDEILIANHLKVCIKNYGFHCAGIAISYEQAIIILQKEIVDAVMLDVNIYGERSGIDLGQQLQNEYKIPFIFLTSYTDSATISQIRKCSPRAYLVKPVNEVALTTNLDLLFDDNAFEKSNMFKFQAGTSIFRIDLNDLLYVKSNANYVIFYFNNDKKLIRSSLKSILDQFPEESLLKINRQVAINPKFITLVKGNHIKTTFDKTFKVSSLNIEDLSKIN